MKLLPIVLLNVITAAVAVIVYDQVRDDDGPAHIAGPAQTVDLSDVERRLAQLEGAQRPALRAEGKGAIDPSQIEAIERRVDLLENHAKAELTAAPADTPSGDVPVAEAGTTPSEDEVSRFRKVAAKAKALDRVKKVRGFLKKALGKIGVDLTDDQQTKLAAVMADFRERRDEIWSEVKQEVATSGVDPDWPRVIEDTNARIQREFTERVSEALPNADAETIAGALTSGGK